MKSLRICLVSKEYPPEGTGGIAKYHRLLAHGLVEAGHDVTVIAGPGDSNVSGRPFGPSNQDRKGEVTTANSLLSSEVKLSRVANKELWLPAPVRRKGRGLWNTLERSFTVDREIARLERTQGPFDVVEMPNWGAEGLCYSLHPRAPLVIRLSTPLAQVSRLKGQRSDKLGLRLACFLEALPARRGASIIANSEFIANYCLELYRLSRAKPFLIPHGIPGPSSPLPKGMTEDRAVTILYVGRLERRKGIDRLLQAIPKVIGSAPQCKFVIAGADIGEAPQGKTYREYFENFATPAARKATTFLGYVEERALSQLYANCDIFAAPSLSESFGLIFLEAMAQAKPVVAFRTGGVPEVVAHNETGILVELDDINELANALIRLAGDVETRQRMGKCGYERVRTRFTAKRMVEETVACYRQVIAEFGKAECLQRRKPVLSDSRLARRVVDQQDRNACC